MIFQNLFLYKIFYDSNRNIALLQWLYINLLIVILLIIKVNYFMFLRYTSRVSDTVTEGNLTFLAYLNRGEY